MTMPADTIQRLQKRKHTQPLCYFAVICAFFSLLLPKYSLFTSYNGVVGILLGTAGLCVLHRICMPLHRSDTAKKGKKANRLLAFLGLFFYLGIAVALTGISAWFIRDCFWSGMSLKMAWLFFLWLLLPAWGKEKAAWQRMVAVSAIGLALFIAGIPLLGISQVPGSGMVDTLTFDPVQILLAAGIYMVLSWYLLLLPGTKTRGMWPDSMEGLMLLVGLFLAFLCLVFRLVYGESGTAFRMWPMLSFLQGISVPGKFLERVDAIWAGACMFAAFLASGLLLEKMFSCLKILGLKGKNARLWRFKDLAAFGVLVLTLVVYRYSGVEVQNRAYAGAFVADRAEDGYVFWFPWQDGKETTKLYAKSFAEARESLNDSQNLQPDFGHIEVTILGESLLEQEELADRLFTELAGWQEMDENSYVFCTADPQTIVETDTKDNSLGKYISRLCENRFGPAKDHLTLRKLLVSWENNRQKTSLPKLVSTKDTLWILAEENQESSG